jgi:hypothetical protein
MYYSPGYGTGKIGKYYSVEYYTGTRGKFEIHWSVVLKRKECTGHCNVVM